MTVLTQLLHQLRRQVRESVAVLPPSKAYQRWRQQFLHDRLKLTIGISSVLLIVLAIVNLSVIIPALSSSTNELLELTREQYRFYPYIFMAQQLGLGLNLLLLPSA